jgi:hypothetical protein
MICYFIKIVIDNGRASPHTHILEWFHEKPMDERLLLSLARDEAEELIEKYHPNYGADYTVEIIEPTAEYLKKTIEKRLTKIKSLEEELEVLR